MAGWFGMDPTRRGLLRGGAALGGAALVSAGGLAGLADLTGRALGNRRPERGGALRIGYLPITDATPLLVAHAQGLFAREGVAVERPVLFRSWALLAEAFSSGTVDMVHLLMPLAVQLRYQLGAAVRIVAWNHTNGSALTVAPTTRRIEQLAGTQVAIPHWWSMHNVVLQAMLRQAGLRPVVRRAPSRSAGTVELVVLSPADMLPALQVGTIGGYIVADPFNAAAEVKGVGRIQRFVGDVWRRHACCAVLLHEELLEKRPQQAQGLLNALTRAQLHARTHRPETARLLSQGRYLPQPVKAITKALTHREDHYRWQGALHHPGWQGQRIDFQPFPFPSYTERLIAAMRQTRVDGDTAFLDGLDPAAVHRDLVDDRFVRRALDRLGGPQTFDLPASLTRTEEVNPA
ncbi:ABC transporter substrate-binding protein [Thermomonospora curvata]|uniref:ABC-type nitrate/sulfonate/bicarbonate transport systems periplasmic components n=1 Tax=Thermomonospora curvata (strain ATCC 19995 / DSM 43183 / JCM 3096 / KCTC 9072 / NBRC 15933 / NCIMB 10081 / Henssen B9) TaxID=471852 RepID=D1AAM3_THECD|nr:ABC transporter substrate-binding protein [Thermomonospora curvata]ACY97033.1 ABC-type nitrate/sulfonate/bicarbonate transport systems periplasmic components [Thermomonospora curvata DSM 43183]